MSGREVPATGAREGRVDIPYEAQLESDPNRMCGAAALTMVYRSLGITCDQRDIWQIIKTPDTERPGKWWATSIGLVRDALDRGLHAVIIRAKDPWQALVLCKEHCIRAILSQRLAFGDPTSHFRVLVDVSGNVAILHDPERGPRERVHKITVLKLWRPAGRQVTGRISIAITDQPSTISACTRCGNTIPATIACPRPTCKKAAPLSPLVVVGCVRKDCEGRTWEHVTCPFCDQDIEPEGRP